MVTRCPWSDAVKIGFLCYSDSAKKCLEARVCVREDVSRRDGCWTECRRPACTNVVIIVWYIEDQTEKKN